MGCTPGPADGWRLVQLDAELSPPSCGLETPAEALKPPLRHKRPQESVALPAAQKILSCAANARLDILVVYPSRNSTGPDALFELSAAEENALFTFAGTSSTALLDRCRHHLRPG